MKRRDFAVIALGLLILVLLSNNVSVTAEETTNPDKSCLLPIHDAASPTNHILALTVLPETAWQPRGGHVLFKLARKGAKLDDLKIIVCFGWRHKGLAVDAGMMSPQLDLISSGDTVVTYSAVVPDLPDVPQTWPRRLIADLFTDNDYHYYTMGIVPIATMRVYATGGGITVPLDEMHSIGITSVWYASAFTSCATLGAFILLTLSARARGVPGRKRIILGVISEPEGYASLSQFQLITWSFVVGSGAVFVLTLSGGLIEIPSQMLILLGITGATTLGARLSGSAVKGDPAMPKRPDPTTDEVTGVEVVAPSTDTLGVRWNAAKSGRYAVRYSDDNEATWKNGDTDIDHEWCRLKGLKIDREYKVQVCSVGIAGGGSGQWSMSATGHTLNAPRTPRWSDLMVSDDCDQIDVTRVQMLFFTCIAASFVAIRLLNTYEIPAVPEGFLWLMGLSNGVYLSGKFMPT